MDSTTSNVLTDVYLLKSIFKFLDLRYRIKVISHVCKTWKIACDFPDCWEHVNLRPFKQSSLWRPHSHPDSAISIAHAIPLDFKDRFGLWATQDRLRNLRSLVLGCPPPLGLHNLIWSLSSVELPKLQVLEVYGTHSTSEWNFVGVPPIVQNYLNTMSFSQYDTFETPLWWVKEPNQKPYLKLKRVVIDSPITYAEVDALKYHMNEIEILVLSKLIPADTDLLLEFSIIEALSQIQPNFLRCICLKISHNDIDVGPRQLYIDHLFPETTNRVLSIEKERRYVNSLLRPSTQVDSHRCFKSDETYATLLKRGSMSPESIRARKTAQEFLDKCLMNKRYQTIMVKGNSLNEDDIGDIVLSILVEHQKLSLRYLIIPYLSTSYTAFSAFRDYCKNIEVWDLPLWRYLY